MTKPKWITQDADYRLKVLTNAFVERPAVSEIIKTMDRVRRAKRIGAEPTCITVTGDSGVGKSTLLEHYRDANPERREEIDGAIQRIQPVLYVPFSSNLTVPMAGDEVLRALLGPKAGMQRRRQNDLIPFHLQRQRVELIMFDEFQHVAERGADKTRAATADWVKHLTKTTKIPVVMAGMKALLPLVEGNAQISSITPYRFVLGEFAFGTTGQKNAFRRFLGELDKLLPFDELAMIGTVDMATRLFTASQGVLRPLLQLLRLAGEFAIEEGAACIRMDHIRDAFDEVGCHPECTVNPFQDEMDKAA